MTTTNGMVEEVPFPVIVLAPNVQAFADECRHYGVDHTDVSFQIIAADGLAVEDVALLPDDTPWLAITGYDPVSYWALQFKFGGSRTFPDIVKVYNLNKAWRRKDGMIP